MMKTCPQCGEKEFYHWKPGYGEWCEICGYTKEDWNLEHAIVDHQDDIKELIEQEKENDKSE